MEQTSYTADAQGHVYLTHNGHRQLMPNFKADAQKHVHVVAEDTDVVIPNVVADGSVNYNIAPGAVRFFAPIGSANTRVSPQVAATIEKIRDRHAPRQGDVERRLDADAPVRYDAQAGIRSRQR